MISSRECLQKFSKNDSSLRAAPAYFFVFEHPIQEFLRRLLFENPIVALQQEDLQQMSCEPFLSARRPFVGWRLELDLFGTDRIFALRGRNRFFILADAPCVDEDAC